MPDDRAPALDARWEGHIPWTLRYPVISTQGDYRKFLTLLSERVNQLFLYNETNIANLSHFVSRLATESLQQYQQESAPAFSLRIQKYFSPRTLDEEALSRCCQDPEEQEFNRLRCAYNLVALAGSGRGSNAKQADSLRDQLQDTEPRVFDTRPTRRHQHWHHLLLDRLEVLQALLIVLAQVSAREPLNVLQRDIRRFAAESGILLGIEGNPPMLVPREEPLFQQAVIDKLLPRLERHFPERAKDLTKAYHDLLNGGDANTIFGNAFKALEELARELTGNNRLMLSDATTLQKHFPRLHNTIHATIINLAGHRGDEGGPGRKGPDEWELRYLLFMICNVALLLMEYREHGG